MEVVPAAKVSCFQLRSKNKLSNFLQDKDVVKKTLNFL